jgi:hypothetical protein
LEGKVAASVWKTENTAVGIRHADHVALLYLQKLALISPTSGGSSVGIVRSRTQATEFMGCTKYRCNLSLCNPQILKQIERCSSVHVIGATEWPGLIVLNALKLSPNYYFFISLTAHTNIN